MTPLDAAYEAMIAAPEGDDAPRLRFYERLADGELVLLLDREPQDENLAPRVFELEDGPVVLVFDNEERLGAFTGIAVPYAALPGRVIARLLSGQGIGLGLNLGVAPSSMLLPPFAVDWLAETLDHAPEETEALPEAFVAPAGLPEALISGLDAKLARAGGLATHALLAGVSYQGGRRGHLLAIIDAAEGAQEALARAAAEALTFSGIEAGEMDVAFLDAGSPAVQAMTRVALRFDLPEPAAEAPPAPQAPPGMDPAKPPRLR